MGNTEKSASFAFLSLRGWQLLSFFSENISSSYFIVRHFIYSLWVLWGSLLV